MFVECNKCTTETAIKTVDHISPEVPRADGINYELQIYHPNHNVIAFINGISHEFSPAELILIGRGDFANAINRIFSACSLVENITHSDQSIRTYFIRQKQQRDLIYSKIHQSYIKRNRNSKLKNDAIIFYVSKSQND